MSRQIGCICVESVRTKKNRWLSTLVPSSGHFDRSSGIVGSFEKGIIQSQPWYPEDVGIHHRFAVIKEQTKQNERTRKQRACLCVCLHRSTTGVCVSRQPEHWQMSSASCTHTHTHKHRQTHTYVRTSRDNNGTVSLSLSLSLSLSFSLCVAVSHDMTND